MNGRATSGEKESQLKGMREEVEGGEENIEEMKRGGRGTGHRDLVLFH